MAGPGGEPIMTTRVDVTGNVAPLEQKLEQAKESVKTAAAEMQSTVSGPYKWEQGAKEAWSATTATKESVQQVGVAATVAAAGFDAISERANAATAATERLGTAASMTFSAMRGKVFLALSSLLLIPKAAKLIETTFESANTKFLKFSRDIVTAPLADRIAAGTAEVKRLDDSIAKLEQYDVSSIFYNKAVEQRRMTEKQLDQDVREMNKKTQEDRVKETRKSLNDLRASMLDEVDKELYERQKAIKTLEDQRKGASEAENELIDEAISLTILKSEREIKGILDKRAAEKKAAEDAEKEREEAQRKADEDLQKSIDKENEMRREEEKRAKEAAERQAKALADAYSGAFDRIRAESANAFPAERLIGSIETMIERLEALADQRSRLRG
jgi:hypothetical protein